VVHKRPVVLAAVKDLGGSGFPGGLGALQYTKNSHKPESSLKKSSAIRTESRISSTGQSE
jgi:hypothetical protein